MDARRPVRAALQGLAAVVGLAAAAYAAYIMGAWSRYGRPAQPHGDEADALLDHFMPAYDVVERRHARIAASAADTLAAASAIDIQRLLLVRALFAARARALRSHEAEAAPEAPRALAPWMQSIGWALLADVPGRELVMGSVTQPWTASPVFQPLPAEEFVAFREPGYVKIAWTLRAEPAGASESRLYHETRAVATDATARARFRRYWAVFSPGIILIRWVMLGPLSPIRRDASRRARLVAASQARATEPTLR